MGYPATKLGVCPDLQTTRLEGRELKDHWLVKKDWALTIPLKPITFSPRD